MSPRLQVFTLTLSLAIASHYQSLGNSVPQFTPKYYLSPKFLYFIQSSIWFTLVHFVHSVATIDSLSSAVHAARTADRRLGRNSSSCVWPRTVYAVLSVHCTLYRVQCTLCAVHCTLKCTLYTMYSVHYTLLIA